jgi:hypothetical protein
MNRNIVVIILIVLFSAVLALYERNWIWTLVSALCIILLAAPAFTPGDKNASYNGKVLSITAIPYILFTAVTAVSLFIDMDAQYYEYAVIALQTLAAMMCGFMLFITLHERTELHLSKRWMMVFSILFACTISVLYTFALFQAMVDAGYPMFNADFEGPSGLDNTESNTVLMMPMVITVFASVIYAIIIRVYLRNVSDEEAGFYKGGGQ